MDKLGPVPYKINVKWHFCPYILNKQNYPSIGISNGMLFAYKICLRRPDKSVESDKNLASSKLLD